MRNPAHIDKPSKFHVSSQLEKTAVEIMKLKEESGRVKKGILKRTEELPVNTKLADAKPWNASVVMEKKTYDENHKSITDRSKSLCQKKREKTLDLSTYVSPINSSIKFQETVKQQKDDGFFEWKKRVYRDPTLDDPVNRSLLRNRHKVEEDRTYTTDKHSGVWQFNSVEGR